MTKYLIPAVLGLVLTVGGASPVLAQGASQSPPAPNSSQNMPQSPNSEPPGARTLAPGSTGTGQTGTLSTTRTQPALTPAPAAPAAK